MHRTRTHKLCLYHSLGGVGELYDLDKDISESKNVAEANPEVVAKLRKLAADYDADLKANTRPLWKE